MAWAKNGTPYTEASTSDDLDITDLTAKKFNMFLEHYNTTGGTARNKLTFNNNTNTVYAHRYEANGGTDVTGVSATNMTLYYGGTQDTFCILYVCSISGEEKLGISDVVDYGTAGAGTAPNRLNRVEKFVPSPDADITRIDCNNDGVGSFNTNSNISAIGTD